MHVKKIVSRLTSVVVVRTTKKIVGPLDPLWTTAHKSLCQTLGRLAILGNALYGSVPKIKIYMRTISQAHK